MAAKSSLQRLLLVWATFSTGTTATVPEVVAKPITATTTSSYSTATLSTSSGFTLSSNITNFIPSCALSCFESFIEANYNTTVCGSSPSLQCLCHQTGSSGYTIGEGATECIIAETNIGNCVGSDASSETVTNAYDMCNDQKNPALKTHATLTATLVVVSGSVFVPNTKTTFSSTTSSSTSVITTSSATSTATSTSQSTTSSSSSFFTTTTDAADTSSSTPTSTAAATSSQSLSQAQIGGIAGGVVAAAILAALLALFIFLRRRRNGGFNRITRDSWSPKGNDHAQHGSPRSIPTISAPMYEEPKVMSFTRALAKRISRQSRFGSSAQQRPGTIGLAISPAGTNVPQQRMTKWPSSGGDRGFSVANPGPAWAPPPPVIRRYSPEPPAVPSAMSPGRAVSSFDFFPQSPPPQNYQSTSPQQQQQQQSIVSPPQPTHQPQQRPNLTVAIPPSSKITIKRASTNRDSIVTEFAEDGEDMTNSALGSALIWRPPNTGADSATTYYVADKWGNWVLGGGGGGGVGDNHTKEHKAAELATPISKTVEEREMYQDKENRKQKRPEVTKTSVVIEDSEAVKAAMRHLSSPTIPESVALRNLGSITKNADSDATTPVSRPSNDSSSLAPPLKATIRLVTPDSGRLPINSRTSSVYSSYTLPDQVAPGTDNPMPTPAAPAGVVTVSKRASRAYPAPPSVAASDSTNVQVHPALRNGSSGAYSAKQSRRRSNSGNNVNVVRRDRSHTMMSRDSSTTIASSVGDSADENDDDAFSWAPSSRQSSYGTYRQSSAAHQADLSPVIESPGRSPVRYPKIPRSRSSAQMYEIAAPKPVNPAVKKIQNSAGQSDSPTLGTIGAQRPQMQKGLSPAAPSEARVSYYQPPSSSADPEGVVGKGSPKLAGPDELSVTKHSRPHQRQYHQQTPPQPVSQSASPSRTGFSQPEAPTQHPQSFQNRINSRAQLPSQSHSRYGPASVYDVYNDPESRRASQETIVRTAAATTAKPTPVVPAYKAIHPPASTLTPTPTSHAMAGGAGPHAAAAAPASSPAGNPGASSSSALLAKRLGAEKAAALSQVPVDAAQRKWARRKSSLPTTTTTTTTTTNNNAAPSSSSQKPHPLPELPKGTVVRKVAPRANLAAGRNNSSDDKENNYHRAQMAATQEKAVPPAVDYEGQGYQEEISSHDDAGGGTKVVSQYFFLPATPGWQPQLTPKRRGDDLFLSVQ